MLRWASLGVAVTGCGTPSPSCGAPRQLVELASPAEDRSPWLSGDGLELIFSSARSGTPSLYRATRTSSSDAFALPELMQLDGASAPYDPFVSDDNTTLWLYDAATSTVMRATRTARGAPFDAPVAEPSIVGRHPSFTPDLLTVYTASLHTTPTQDILEMHRASIADPFDPPTVVVSTPVDEQGPSIAADGDALLLGSRSLTEDQSVRVGRTTRTTSGWSTPELASELEPLAGTDDRDPQRRGGTGPIVFASDRAGAGDLDVWITCE